MHRFPWTVIPWVLEGPNTKQTVKCTDPWKKFNSVRAENKKCCAPTNLGTP